MKIQTIVGLFLGLLAAACSTPPAPAPGPSVEAPRYSVGQRWTYNEINGFNNLSRGTVVRDVAATGPLTRIVTLAPDGRIADDATVVEGRLVNGAFSDRTAGRVESGIVFRPFPLVIGQRWSDRQPRLDSVWKEIRPTRIDGVVRGWETVRVPAGEFKAIKIERQMYLGDSDVWRGETVRFEQEWYVPEIGAAVKLIVREDYRVMNRRTRQSTVGDWFIWEMLSSSRP